MLILQLLLFAAVAVWGFGYYLRSTAEAPQKPPEELPEEMPPAPPKMDRRQRERAAANCLYFSMTDKERAERNIYQYCRDASDSELTAIIERFKTEY
jgi:hypothetical protein